MQITISEEMAGTDLLRSYGPDATGFVLWLSRSTIGAKPQTRAALTTLRLVGLESRKREKYHSRLGFQVVVRVTPTTLGTMRRAKDYLHGVILTDVDLDDLFLSGNPVPGPRATTRWVGFGQLEHHRGGGAPEITVVEDTKEGSQMTLAEATRKIIKLVRPELSDDEVDAGLAVAAPAASRAAREGFDFEGSAAEHEEFEAAIKKVRS